MSLILKRIIHMWRIYSRLAFKTFKNSWMYWQYSFPNYFLLSDSKSYICFIHYVYVSDFSPLFWTRVSWFGLPFYEIHLVACGEIFWRYWQHSFPKYFLLSDSKSYLYLWKFGTKSFCDFCWTNLSRNLHLAKKLIFWHFGSYKITYMIKYIIFPQGLKVRKKVLPNGCLLSLRNKLGVFIFCWSSLERCQGPTDWIVFLQEHQLSHA